MCLHPDHIVLFFQGHQKQQAIFKAAETEEAHLVKWSLLFITFSVKNISVLCILDDLGMSCSLPPAAGLVQ